MNDRTPWLRTAKLILHPPVKQGGDCRYALTTFSITTRGTQNGRVLLDGVLRGIAPAPTTEELLEAFDAALRQHRLHL